jgi:membrane protein YdbS with pleckstrin-like domain
LLLTETWGALLVALVLLLVLATLLLPVFSEVSRNTWLDTRKGPVTVAVVLGVYLAFRGVSIALRAARLRATRYKLTNQRLVVETGLASRTLAEVDLRSVEDLVFRQGPMERLLGIGTIGVVSSDRNTPRLQLVGVKDPRGTRELIRTQAYAATQRQLFTRST